MSTTTYFVQTTTMIGDHDEITGKWIVEADVYDHRAVDIFAIHPNLGDEIPGRERPWKYDLRDMLDEDTITQIEVAVRSQFLDASLCECPDCREASARAAHADAECDHRREIERSMI